MSFFSPSRQQSKFVTSPSSITPPMSLQDGLGTSQTMPPSSSTLLSPTPTAAGPSFASSDQTDRQPVASTSSLGNGGSALGTEETAEGVRDDGGGGTLPSLADLLLETAKEQKKMAQQAARDDRSFFRSRGGGITGAGKAPIDPPHSAGLGREMGDEDGTVFALSPGEVTNAFPGAAGSPSWMDRPGKTQPPPLNDISPSDPYLSSLLSQPLPDLISLPTTLKSRLSSLSSSLSSLTQKSHPTILSSHSSSLLITQHLSSLSSNLSHFSSTLLPKLQSSTSDFTETTKPLLIERSKLTNLGSEGLGRVMDLVNVPELVGRCVRTNQWNEAMGLADSLKELVRNYEDEEIRNKNGKAAEASKAARRAEATGGAEATAQASIPVPSTSAIPTQSPPPLRGNEPPSLRLLRSLNEQTQKEILALRSLILSSLRARGLKITAAVRGIGLLRRMEKSRRERELELERELEALGGSVGLGVDGSGTPAEGETDAGGEFGRKKKNKKEKGKGRARDDSISGSAGGSVLGHAHRRTASRVVPPSELSQQEKEEEEEEREKSLRLMFLISRYFCLVEQLSPIESQLAALPIYSSSSSSDQHGQAAAAMEERVQLIKKWIEVWREVVGEASGMFAGIFLGSTSAASAPPGGYLSAITGLTSSEQTSRPNSTFKPGHAAQLSISQLPAASMPSLPAPLPLFLSQSLALLNQHLTTHLPHINTASSLSSVLTQLSYCADSFGSRWGFNFKQTVSEMVVSRLGEVIEQRMEEGVRAFVDEVNRGMAEGRKTKAARDSRWKGRGLGKTTTGVAVEEWLIAPDSQDRLLAMGLPPLPSQSRPAGSGDNPYSHLPPPVLSQFPPAARFLNSQASALNELRLLPAVSLYASVRKAQLNGLRTAAETAIELHAAAHGQGSDASIPISNGHATPSHRRSTSVETDFDDDEEHQARERQEKLSRLFLAVFSRLLVPWCDHALRTEIFAEVSSRFSRSRQGETESSTSVQGISRSCEQYLEPSSHAMDGIPEADEDHEIDSGYSLSNGFADPSFKSSSLPPPTKSATKVFQEGASN